MRTLALFAVKESASRSVLDRNIEVASLFHDNMGTLQKGFPDANYSSFFKVGGVKSSICRLFEHHMQDFILTRCATVECNYVL